MPEGYLMPALPGARSHFSPKKLTQMAVNPFAPASALTMGFSSKPQTTFVYSSQCVYPLTCVVEGGWFDGAVLEISICGCYVFKIAFVKECVLKEDMLKVHLYEPVGKTASLSEVSQAKRNARGQMENTEGQNQELCGKGCMTRFQASPLPHFLQLLFCCWQ